MRGTLIGGGDKVVGRAREGRAMLKVDVCLWQGDGLRRRNGCGLRVIEVARPQAEPNRG